MILAQLPAVAGQTLELGSGGGFFKEALSEAITSDVQDVPGADRRIDAKKLPFNQHALRAIVGTNVLHHVASIGDFFAEAERVLNPGGRLVFIEPWPTPWSIPIYRYLHHEVFDMQRGWDFPAGGPLTAANGALPWIVFQRDRQKFERSHPRLKILEIRPFMPFTYLFSGGIGRRWPLPPRLFAVFRWLEKPFDFLGLFALIVLEKSGSRSQWI